MTPLAFRSAKTGAPSFSASWSSAASAPAATIGRPATMTGRFAFESRLAASSSERASTAACFGRAGSAPTRAAGPAGLQQVHQAVEGRADLLGAVGLGVVDGGGVGNVPVHRVVFEDVQHA